MYDKTNPCKRWSRKGGSPKPREAEEPLRRQVGGKGSRFESTDDANPEAKRAKSTLVGPRGGDSSMTIASPLAEAAQCAPIHDSPWWTPERFEARTDKQQQIAILLETMFKQIKQEKHSTKPEPLDIHRKIHMGQPRQ